MKKRGYFTHNPAQQTCACGVTLLPSPLPPGYYLYEPKCNEPGYSIHVLVSARVCVKYVDNKVNFAAAEAACLRDGAAYVFMTDSKEKIDLVRQFDSNNVWVGLTDREEEGVYRWADGRPVTTGHRGLYSYGEPNNYYAEPGEDCTIVYNYDDKLNDYRCSKSLTYVCEIAIE